MRAALLISLHDVSPATLARSRDAVALLAEHGVAPAALTVLVVPRPDDRDELADSPQTVAFLHDLADRGATLVAHGFTHRMARAPRTPLRWLVARWFARGEGELAASDAGETATALARADACFERAGLAQRMVGFVPPAWLMSRAAHAAVVARAFGFYERFGGIVVGQRRFARRLIGWGSLTAIEAAATSAWAWLQVRRAPADTRLAIHPPDLARASTRRSVVAALRALVPRLEPTSYASYVQRVVDRAS